MTDSSEAKRVQWTAALAALRCYGIAVISVGIAVGLANTFLYFHLPQPFAAFALSAIAVTFWYGGTKPGILAAVLSMLIRSYFFAPEINTVSRIGYDLVFLIFALLMTGVRRARNDLEVRVTERTAELTRANEDLSREIAERKRAEEKLRQTEAYLAEAQRLSHVGSWAWSAATKDLLHVSEEWRRIYGIAEDEVVPSWEQRIQRIHPLDRERYADVIETAILTKIGYELDCRIVRLDGEMRDVHIVGHPVFGPSGDVVEYMGTVIDTTESKRADESLRRSEAYLSEAQRLTHTGRWVWEVAGREALHLSEEWYRIYGFEPDQGAPVWEQRLQRIHPEDRAKWLEAIDRAISERSDYEVEFRILLPEGEVKHIHTVGHPVLSASG